MMPTSGDTHCSDVGRPCQSSAHWDLDERHVSVADNNRGNLRALESGMVSVPCETLRH